MAADPVLPIGIETERPILRPGSEGDAPALALWVERDPRARRRIAADRRPTLDEPREQIRDWNTSSRRVAEKVGFRASRLVDHDPERGDSLRYVRDAMTPEVSR